MFTCMLPAAAVCADVAEQTDLVPPDDYPILDTIVTGKFLTSQTRMVLLERLTTTRLHPEEDRLPSLGLFEERAFFESRLPTDLIRDFVAKNQRSSKLEARFAFGVRYRFVSGDGTPDMAAGRPGFPVTWGALAQVQDVDTIDRLVFSRVGLTLKADQALVYVANPRPDGTGGGFLVWLGRSKGRWYVAESEVIWVSRPDEGPVESP